MKSHERENNPEFLTDPLLSLILFGGKGGTGKTTCSVSTALCLAATNPQQSYLLLSTDPAHSIADSLHKTILPPNLTFEELDAENYLIEFKHQHRKDFEEIAKRGTFLDDDDIRSFLDLSLPGLDEVVSLFKISDWLQEGLYDTIVIDTAPTGHTLRLLEVPALIQTWIQALDTLLAKHRYMKKVFSGHYAQDALDEFILDLDSKAKRVETLLKNRQRTRFVPVALAEELVLSETSNLINRLKDLEIPVHEIIINKIKADSTCPICCHRYHKQQSLINENSDWMAPYRIWTVPVYLDEVRGEHHLKLFWQSPEPWKKSKSMNQPLPSKDFQWEGPLVEYDDTLSFILFAGKGGVGKTTLAAASALSLCKHHPRRKILLYSTDPAHSLSHLFNRPIGSEPCQIKHQLFALEIDAPAEFERLKKDYREELEEFWERLAAGFDFTFDREVMERLMDLSPPGIDEIMAMTLATEFLSKEAFDLFIMDSAPTGHLIRLLEMPQIMDQWLKQFFQLFLKYKQVFQVPTLARRLVTMSKELKRLRETLTDAKRSALYAVTILTHMALEETRDLISACQRLKIEVPALLINMATPISDCSFCTTAHKQEESVTGRYESEFPGIKKKTIDYVGTIKNLEALTRLGEGIVC
ncbi:MAG: TRC40/GET3/ArsA family transport-energizing ATPase [Proteobacteria bacterium]|nr:TRC40/GET3/ArsA family transport-energizing ATPase [Pseudomonadota bacterium]